RPSLLRGRTSLRGGSIGRRHPSSALVVCTRSEDPMRAAVITNPGGAAEEAFAVQEVPDPVVGPEDVLVAVKASALNRADLLQRRGRYNGPPGTRNDIAGLEAAGI